MGQRFEGKVGDDDGEATIVYFGDGATARATCTRASCGRRCTTRRSCSSARTTSGRSPSRRTAVPVAPLPARPRLRLPRHPRRRQRRARHARGVALGARPVPARQRAGADRGVHLPHGRPHHDRRPDPLPAVGRAGGVEAQGPDRAGAGQPGPARAGRPGVLRLGAGRLRPARHAAARVLRQHAPPATRADVLQGLRGGPPHAGRTAGRLPGFPRVVRRKSGTGRSEH